MNHILTKSLTIILLCSSTGFIHAQGCSDAGFCTLNSFKPNSNDTAQTNNQLKLGLSFGSADHTVRVIGNYIEYNRKINDRFGVDAKITALSQQGNEFSVWGVSDVYLNANYNLRSKANFTAGIKIPCSQGNRMQDGRSLPMDYQASLGTFDLILGIGYVVKGIQIAAAIQQPLTQNKNEFLAENHPLDSPLRSFQSTNQFKRSGDVLLRVSYPLDLGEKWKITPGVLPIYHLANDRYTNISGIEQTIEGSQGLTLNLNAFVDYTINSKHALQLNAGVPVLVRDARPDGLTRSFVTNLEYRVKF